MRPAQYLKTNRMIYCIMKNVKHGNIKSTFMKLNVLTCHPSIKYVARSSRNKLSILFRNNNSGEKSFLF